MIGICTLLGQFDLRGGGEPATVDGGGGDGARVHQRDVGHLAVGGLGALAVGEVARRVADGQAAVRRNVARAEARPAERRAQHHARRREIRRRAVLHQLDELRLAGGVQAHGERVRADALAAHNVRHGHDVLKRAARAARHDALLDIDLAVPDLVGEPGHGVLFVHHAARFLFHLGQQLLRVLAELADGIGIGGVEGQRDHGLDGAQIHLDKAVVHGALLRVQLAERLGALVGLVPAAHLLVGLPDGGQAGGLSGHDVDAVAVLDGEAADALAHELHHLVLDEARCEHRADDGQCDVLRTDAAHGLAGQVDGNDVGVGNVIGLFAQLLDQLGTALAHAHGAQRAVAGVRVGAQQHLAAARHALAHVLVDDGLMGGHIDAAVLLRRGQAKKVVVLVDGAAHRAQGVMAVGQHIGQRELLHTRGARGLDDADIGDVVGRHAVELDLELFVLTGGVVRREYGMRHGLILAAGAVGLCKRTAFILIQARITGYHRICPLHTSLPS